MCENCKDVLIKFKQKHAPQDCPLLQSAYCGVCAKRGHFRINCPDLLTKSYQKPRYLEELIPYDLADRYQITSRTPLPTLDPIPISYKESVFEVSRNAAIVRSVLGAYGRNCKNNGATAAKENEIEMEKLAKELKKRLVWTDSVPTLDELQVQIQVAAPSKPATKERKSKPKKVILTTSTG